MEKVKVDKESALIIVDVQNDFLPGGALPVPNGDKVIPILNKYIELFNKVGAAIFATRDWHPPNHISFKTQGGIWPPHCIQNSKGAEFASNLKLPKNVNIISKAVNPNMEAYSGFEGTDLALKLKELGVKKVFIGGLATDYCVKNTVLDALKEGFKTFLLEDASRGVNLKPEDSENAIKEMVNKGALKVKFSDLTF
ncbi:MAG: bifunctional nicotinamidase/pyrazinamidase [Candidatus Bathyarchaeia archaeon]|nr:bifunctional nicotinamidase/pyrazinamidase [Candidatus Bathyarchaeota archaeon]